MPNTGTLWWSLLWRLWAALLLTSLVFNWSGLGGLFWDERLFKWKWSVLWLLYAVVFWLTGTFSPLKLMRALWGTRLGLGAKHWRVIGRGVFIVFLSLAILNALVAYGASTDTWIIFMRFAFPLIVAAVWVIAAAVRRLHDAV
jgi:intracellular septation protein A